MRTLLASVVLVGFGTAALADDKFETEKLMGEWKVTDGKKGGDKIGDDAKKTVITFEKEKMTMKLSSPMGEMVFEFKYTIDAKVSPVAIDLEIAKGPIGEGSKAKGIIELKGDELKLSYPPMDGDRPAKMDDGKNHYFVLKKAEKKEEKKVEEKKEEKKVEEKKEAATKVIK
jgi:uncharacterized protein (TIGR03067 family)